MKHRAQILAYSGTFVALIAAGSWISIPLPPVPLTLQTLFVLLAGVVMRRYAVIPVGLYVLLGAANLPIFHNGTAGLGVLLGPTGGFLIGFVPAALITGLAYEQESPKLPDRRADRSDLHDLLFRRCMARLLGVDPAPPGSPDWRRPVRHR